MRSKINIEKTNHGDTGLSTKRMAAAFDVAEQTPRASLCRNGHWMCMIPIKLPSGRLLWRAAEVERLLSGKSVSENLTKGSCPVSKNTALHDLPLVQFGSAVDTEGERDE